ncbi:TRAP transporter substrate-binding protein [Granulosicoccus sp.]|nr:TRAP transporter substrate-binding protein [Granulosicoccus sp.]
MKTIKKLAAVLALSTGLAMPAMAQDHNLRISTWLPPSHGINTEIFGGLISMMEEATNGAVTGELVSGLAPPPAQMDLILDGAADIGIIFHGYQPGRFVATKLVELPGYEGTSEASAVAYWQVFEDKLAALDEHRGVKVIALMTHGPAQLHMREPVESLEDLKGMKTRLPGGVASNVAERLGLVGINVPAPQVYETLESGAADAVAMNVGERIGFKLNEVAPVMYEIPGGLYRGSFAIIMSQETFDGLPEEVQGQLDTVFGEAASRMSGAAWDLSDKLAYDAMGESTTIIEASEADQAKFAEIAEAVKVDVLAEIDDAGVDAQSAYQEVVDAMAAEK